MVGVESDLSWPAPPEKSWSLLMCLLNWPCLPPHPSRVCVGVCNLYPVRTLGWSGGPG